MNKKGKLYICGTPIGNLDDISLRALDTLREVDLIAAEDTRRTLKLLNHFEISTSLISYHEHNELERTPELLRLLDEGQNLALVSDAGMPGISDPGMVIVKDSIAAGCEVIPIPGPTAVISALVVSGLSMDRFVFEGFLPRKGEERKEILEQLQRETRTIILYESPYRLKNTLSELSALLGKRRIAVVRELTKIHEEKLYGSAEEILAELGDRKIKGEIVLVIEGGREPESESEGWEELTVLEHLKLMMEQGFTKKQAIKEVASERGIPKREVYREAVVIDARKR